MNPVKEHKPIISFGAGALFIDRYTDNGGVRGSEVYMGDTTAASISATVERTTVYSGDGAVATKLIDKVRQIDRSMSITCQDATLDNFALFMMADRPEQVAAGSAAEDLVTVIRVPEHVTDRTYFQLGSGSLGVSPAGRPAFALGDDPIAAGGWMERTSGAGGAFKALRTAIAAGDYVLDSKTGRLRFTATGIAKVKGKEFQITIAAAKITALPAHGRVTVDAEVRQIRVAVRYIEHADPGAEARNLYIPQATLSPSGELALKGRDTPQQFPLALSIETPDGDLAQMYIDGVPA